MLLLRAAHKNRRERERDSRYLDLIFLVVVQRADGRAGFRLAASFLAAAFLRTLVRGHDDDERLDVFFLRSSFVVFLSSKKKEREEKKKKEEEELEVFFFLASFFLFRLFFASSSSLTKNT